MMWRCPAVPFWMFRCRVLTVLELQRALTAAGSHRPVIFITGKGDIPTSVRAMKAGAMDFLTKPVKDKDLLEAVSRELKPGTPSSASFIQNWNRSRRKSRP